MGNGKNGKKPELILVSASPRRKEILEKAKYTIEVKHSGFIEKSVKDTSQTRSLSVAREKMDYFISKNFGWGESLGKFGKPILTADTIVVYKGSIREKPKNHSELMRWIREYGSSQEPAVILSSIVLISSEGRRAEGTEEAIVHFNEFEAEYIVKHLARDLFLDRAGGFDVGHQLWKLRIKKIIGMQDCVRGMPMELFEKLIKEVS